MCPQGQIWCNNVCVDIMGDVENCGACDAWCIEGERCMEGECVVMCVGPGGYVS